MVRRGYTFCLPFVRKPTGKVKFKTVKFTIKCLLKNRHFPCITVTNLHFHSTSPWKEGRMFPLLEVQCSLDFIPLSQRLRAYNSCAIHVKTGIAVTVFATSSLENKPISQTCRKYSGKTHRNYGSRRPQHLKKNVNVIVLVLIFTHKFCW